jgi:hypothetical protein
LRFARKRVNARRIERYHSTREEEDMRHWTLAALTLTTIVMSACGGETPSPQPPPASPPATAAAAASASASPADTTPPPPPKPTLAELVPQTLKGVEEAFNAHDAKKISAYYTEDATTARRRGATRSRSRCR